MRRERGFTYLAVLWFVAATAASSTVVATMWHTAAQREREQELLAVGHEIRTAIGRYLAAAPEGRRSYPRSLDDLVLDTRQLPAQRHLRRVYPDPVTGRTEWGLIRSADGGIAGVHSLSSAAPFKQQGFEGVNADFNGAARLADWRFVHREVTALAPATPAPARPAR